MTLPVRFLPEATGELDAAVAFHESRKQGLGADFAIEVRDGLARIQQFPEAWQSLARRVRRYRLQRFRMGSCMRHCRPRL
jgi:hypothetical protein